MRYAPWIAAASLALMSTASAQTEGDAAKGKVLYTTCVACHGPNGEGNEQLNSPSLIGLQDWYIIRQLNNFKEGIRGGDPRDIYGAQMRPMAMTLPDEQSVADVTAYIVSLNDKPEGGDGP